MLLLDIVGGKGGSELRDADGFAKAAAAAKAVTEDDLVAIGPSFKAQQDTFKRTLEPNSDV